MIAGLFQKASLLFPFLMVLTLAPPPIYPLQSPAGPGSSEVFDSAWPTAAWSACSPEEQGMDSALLEQASQFIDLNCPTRFSLLVVRNGRLVFERYYHGSRATDANNIKSISKSILSMLVGVALEEGLLNGVDQKLDEFFPEYFRAGDDPRKNDVNLGHLLTMTAGFEWQENGPISHQCFTSWDWHRFVIESRLVSTPGEVFNYSTGLTHLVSGILTKVSGASTRDFATSRLFVPLGMTCTAWSQDRRGYYFGGSEVWLTPRDLAKFSLLFLRDGRWEDRQLVSRAWIRDSARLRVRTREAGWGDFGDYAYLWWKTTILGYPLTLCSGYGGQNIFLIPELDLAMITTARSDIANESYWTYADPYNIMAQYIIPAVKQDPPLIQPGSVVHLADRGNRLAPGVFASVSGCNFSLGNTSWDEAMPADGGLPPGIGGVRVHLGGNLAYPRRVGEDRIEFLVPSNQPTGRHSLRVRTPHGSTFEEVEVAEFAPAFYTVQRDGVSWASLPPVFAGQTVRLQASGLGPSVPPAPVGADFDEPRPLASMPAVFVAGRPAELISAVLASPGIWEVTIRVPDGIPPGNASLQLTAGEVSSDGEAMLRIVPAPPSRRRR